jgi:transcription termination factor Rho
MPKPWFALIVLFTGGCVVAQQPKAEEKRAEAKAPPELGRVPFLRDYAAAVAKAKADKKPLFVLFDEVPG